MKVHTIRSLRHMKIIAIWSNSASSTYYFLVAVNEEPNDVSERLNRTQLTTVSSERHRHKYCPK